MNKVTIIIKIEFSKSRRQQIDLLVEKSKKRSKDQLKKDPHQPSLLRMSPRSFSLKLSFLNNLKIRSRQFWLKTNLLRKTNWHRPHNRPPLTQGLLRLELGHLR